MLGKAPNGLRDASLAWFQLNVTVEHVDLSDSLELFVIVDKFQLLFVYFLC